MKERIEVTLAEVADCYRTHESLYDFLAERIEEKLGRALDFFQMVDYAIVGHKGAMIEVEIEGYEDNV